jgi:small Trp-rich protein
MYLLVFGIVLLLLKYLEIGPVATWGWLWVLAPFAAAAVWWIWADASGYTKKKAVERMDKKKQERINRHKEALGLAPVKKRR